MYNNLHSLKLVLPERPSFRLEADVDGLRRYYTWPCGCCAGGSDDAALALRCCSTHLELLTPGHSVRPGAAASETLLPGVGGGPLG